MSDPITPAAACCAILSAETTGRTPSRTLSAHVLKGISDRADAEGVSPDDLIRSIAAQGDEKDQRIAKLEGALMFTESSLAEWLTDNTEDDFGEQPEIDGLRTVIDDVLNPADRTG